ncbi:MAG: hypothetical protein QFF03_00795 [Pseudomonadota bacterium]|nr:hypothetical protein [Pseudomonadota bacterium]
MQDWLAPVNVVHARLKKTEVSTDADNLETLMATSLAERGRRGFKVETGLLKIAIARANCGALVAADCRKTMPKLSKVAGISPSQTLISY